MNDMCELCAGSHVVPKIDGSIIEFETCQNCGPMSKEKFLEMMDELENKIREAEKKFYAEVR